LRNFNVSIRLSSYKISAVDRRAIMKFKLESEFEGYPRAVVIGVDFQTEERRVIPNRSSNIQAFLTRTPEETDGQ
jgi:hypothetical protein